jgi:hypothetical protein
LIAVTYSVYPVFVGEFKVPFGLDQQGDRVYPKPSVGEMQLICPNPKCGGPLVLHVGKKIRRDGTVRATHFKHKPNTYDPRECNPETWEHLTAKGCIARAVQKWIDGKGTPPKISSLSRANTLQRLLAAMSKGAKPSRVHIEKPYKDLIPDVSLVFDKNGVGILALAVEVRAFHPVDPHKAKKFARHEISWIELDAHSIIEDPLVWQDIAEQEAETQVTDAPLTQASSASVLVPDAYKPNSRVRPDWLKLGKVVAGGLALVWLLSILEDES